jgi:hypothetical protein
MLNDLQAQDNPVVVAIGGVEYSGYSAQSQTTNGFFNLFYGGPTTKGFSGWGRIRLTSAPQQATNGVESLISSPSGLTTYDYSNVGQVLDFVAGGAYKLSENWQFVVGFGAVTPLSSQKTPITFVAPSPNTNECTQLVNRFSPAQGYNPGLALNTGASPTTCLAGGYGYVAFSNEDRSSFLLKYGAGFRTTLPSPLSSSQKNGDSTDPYAVLDTTIGRDESVTGGKLHRLVFKFDAVLPIPTSANSSWLYLFGSAYIRMSSSQTLAPLFLAAPPNTVTVPSPSVFVLPLRQPNRDYYRIGVGLNINELFKGLNK